MEKNQNKFQRFPWKIFGYYVLWLTLVFGFILYVIQYFIFKSTFKDFNFSLDWFLYQFTISFFLSLFVSFKFSQPLQRIQFKATQLSLKKSQRQDDPYETERDLVHEEPGEFSDIEHALIQIQKKMKKRKEQLLKSNEEAFAFMSSVQEALISIDLEGKVQFCNSQFSAQFLSPTQMITSLYLTDIFRLPEVVEVFDKVKQQGRSRKLTLKMGNRLDSHLKDYSISVAPLKKMKTSEIYGVIGVFHDISDIKKAEQIRIDFVANASHELRTPLTTIKGYVDTIKSDLEEKQYDQAEKFINVVSRNVNRLIDLVSDLLSLSNIESQGELKLSYVNALELSHLVVSDHLIQANEKKQKIQVLGDIPIFKADANKLDQVLRNLLSNAIKYSHDEGFIKIIWEKNSKSEVVLKVSDDGPGIPEEHHERLFERFYRIDRGRSRDMGGTGLGLAIVKHIMQCHSGKAFVRTSEKGGAEFVCIFPEQK